MKPICFVATQNPPKSLQFYQESLGLKLLSDDSFATAFDMDGTMLRVQKVHKLIPAQYTVLGWEVPDISAAVKDLGRGVRFEHFEGLGQDDSGIWKSPAGARIAWFKDPDGNILSLVQFR